MGLGELWFYINSVCLCSNSCQGCGTWSTLLRDPCTVSPELAPMFLYWCSCGHRTHLPAAQELILPGQGAPGLLPEMDHGDVQLVSCNSRCSKSSFSHTLTLLWKLLLRYNADPPAHCMVLNYFDSPWIWLRFLHPDQQLSSIKFDSFLFLCVFGQWPPQDSVKRLYIGLISQTLLRQVRDQLFAS